MDVYTKPHTGWDTALRPADPVRMWNKSSLRSKLFGDSSGGLGWRGDILSVQLRCFIRPPVFVSRLSRSAPNPRGVIISADPICCAANGHGSWPSNCHNGCRGRPGPTRSPNLGFGGSPLFYFFLLFSVPHVLWHPRAWPLSKTLLYNPFSLPFNRTEQNRFTGDYNLNLRPANTSSSEDGNP